MTGATARRTLVSRIKNRMDKILPSRMSLGSVIRVTGRRRMTGIGQGFVSRSIWSAMSLIAGVTWACVVGAEPARFVLERDSSVIVLEPYAPNIVRVSLSLDRAEALAAPGYGFVAAPSAEGWIHERSEEGDVYRSPRLVVVVAAHRPYTPLATQLDIARFFSGSAPPADITIDT